LIGLDAIDESEKDKLFKDVYVIVDGAVVLHKSYSKSSKEPALISGFIGAIASFAREITTTGILKKVLIPPVKFVASQVMEHPQVIIALLVSDKLADDISEQLLQSIADAVLEKHLNDIIDSKGQDLTEQVSKEVHEAMMRTIRSRIDKKKAEEELNRL
jgi:N-methylhydantoinase B/oxoprolinase/acetone carboxylase alpha subunit